MKKMLFKKTIWSTIPVLFLVLALNAPIMGEENEPLTSYKYIVVYGTGDLEVGDLVEFFDPDGVLCGKWTVRDKGAYGLMAVYGDDPTTAEVDEGAEKGDELTVRVNGIVVLPPDGDPVFEKEGETRRVDL